MSTVAQQAPARRPVDPATKGRRLMALESRPRSLFGNQLRWAGAVIADWIEEYRSKR
jgi:hypothetical protein